MNNTHTTSELMAINGITQIHVIKTTSKRHGLYIWARAAWKMYTWNTIFDMKLARAIKTTWHILSHYTKQNIHLSVCVYVCECECKINPKILYSCFMIWKRATQACTLFVLVAVNFHIIIILNVNLIIMFHLITFVNRLIQNYLYISVCKYECLWNLIVKCRLLNNSLYRNNIVISYLYSVKIINAVTRVEMCVHFTQPILSLLIYTFTNLYFEHIDLSILFVIVHDYLVVYYRRDCLNKFVYFFFLESSVFIAICVHKQENLHKNISRF